MYMGRYDILYYTRIYMLPVFKVYRHIYRYDMYIDIYYIHRRCIYIKAYTVYLTIHVHSSWDIKYNILHTYTGSYTCLTYSIQT